MSTCSKLVSGTEHLYKLLNVHLSWVRLETIVNHQSQSVQVAKGETNPADKAAMGYSGWWVWEIFS